MPPHTHRSRLPVRLALAGIACLVGGEIFCIVGPLRYERIVYVICHAILYGGVALVAVAAAMHWTARFSGSKDDKHASA